MVQRAFQHRPRIAAGGFSQAEVFVLQHQLGQHGRPVGAALKQGRLKGGGTAGGFRFRCVQQAAQRFDQRLAKKPPEYHKPVQAGQNLFPIHFVSHPFKSTNHFYQSDIIHFPRRSCKFRLTSRVKCGIVELTKKSKCSDGK